MHHAVILDQMRYAARGEIDLHVPVEERAVADGQGGEIDHGTRKQETGFQQARQVDLAEAEDGQHDHQLQEQAADKTQLLGCEDCLLRGSVGKEHHGEIEDRHQGKDQRDMHVKMLLPDEHVQQRTDQGSDKDSLIVDTHSTGSLRIQSPVFPPR